MSGIEQIKLASNKAEEIVASFNGQVPTDAVEARKAELHAELDGMKTVEKIEFLLNKLVELEKPKSSDGITVETVARKFMEAPELALFNWPQIALLVHRVLPNSKTTAKSIASYASKRKDTWAIVPREKFTFNPADLASL